MKKPLFILGFIEALPLPIFLLYGSLIDQHFSHNWQGPLVAGSIVAILTTTILLWNKVLLNRLMIGINAYLITGSLGQLTEHIWINQLYEYLEASGMLG